MLKKSEQDFRDSCKGKFYDKHQALKVAAIYCLLGSLWILLSDRFVGFFFKDPTSILFISIIKGWVYVAVTSILIYFLVSYAIRKVRSQQNRINEINAELTQKVGLLDESNTLLKSIIESSPQVIVFALDCNYRYITFNKKHKSVMKEIWGRDIEVGMSMLDVIADQADNYKARYNFDRTLAGESFTLTEEYGDEKLARLTWINYYSPIYSNDGKIIGLTCFVLNITERKKAEEEILYLSYHDALTGLYNRRFYEEEIKRLDTDRNLPISIIVGDVNGLKLINDAFGHEKGDELLRKAALIIQSACRTDDIVARWGGDEFVILLPNTRPDEAEKIVGRIRSHYQGNSINAVNVSISFGWDTKNTNDEDIFTVLKNAEDYMYKCKIIENASVRGNAINTILRTLHEKNPREEQHAKRVSELCQSIGKAMGYKKLDINKLKVVGLLHDIGKIAIEESILNKPDTLTVHELEQLRRHPEIGYRIISSSYDMLDLAGEILAHHERWDGTGYPKGLRGEEIPYVSRIIAIADSFDAMTSERPFRSAISEAAAVKEIIRCAGTQFDPEIARLFVEKVLERQWDA